MKFTIGEIAEKGKVIQPSTKCENAYNTFKEIPSLEGIVVCSQDVPVGLVMKTHFYQTLSTKYGFNLFMNRTIDLVMNSKPLIVDYSVPITEISGLAMDRSTDHLYDYVIVTLHGKMYGIVSIKNLLMKLTEIQVNIARNSNPLTGLPGNFVINEKLQEVLQYPMFSVLYIDIDFFKVFNDTHGFKSGDDLIRETASIIVNAIEPFFHESAFVGHIGGDDFIAVIPNYDYVPVCQTIITRFDQMSRRYYREEELAKGYVQAVSRKGRLENTPLLSISIAVISNQDAVFQTVDQLSQEAANVKKQCKTIKKSVYLTMMDCLEANS